MAEGSIEQIALNLRRDLGVCVAALPSELPSLQRIDSGLLAWTGAQALFPQVCAFLSKIMSRPVEMDEEDALGVSVGLHQDCRDEAPQTLRTVIWPVTFRLLSLVNVVLLCAVTGVKRKAAASAVGSVTAADPLGARKEPRADAASVRIAATGGDSFNEHYLRYFYGS